MNQILKFWLDFPNPADPSSKNEIQKMRQTKKLTNFVDKMADKSRMHKVNVEFYQSDDENPEGDLNGQMPQK